MVGWATGWDWLVRNTTRDPLARVSFDGPTGVCSYLATSPTAGTGLPLPLSTRWRARPASRRSWSWTRNSIWLPPARLKLHESPAPGPREGFAVVKPEPGTPRAAPTASVLSSVQESTAGVT